MSSMSSKPRAPVRPARHRLHLLQQTPSRDGKDRDQPDPSQVQTHQIDGWLGALAQAENMAELAAAKINSLLDTLSRMSSTDGVRLRLAKAHLLNALDEMEGLRIRLRRPT